MPFLAALAVAMPGFQQTDAAASAVGGCSVPQGLPDFIDRTETEGGIEGSVHDGDTAGSSDDVESGKAAGLEGRQAARSFSARGAVGRRYRFSQVRLRPGLSAAPRHGPGTAQASLGRRPAAQTRWAGG